MNASRTCALLLMLLFVLARAGTGMAAEGDATARPVVPMLLDPERRMERKELPRGTTLRFVTEEDYPPFNYIGRDGQLAGFNVDLARAICTELSVTCTIQSRQWSLLLPALDKGEADAVIASHRITGELRRAYEVSLPTFRSPARFAARQAEAGAEATPAALKGKSVALIGGSAHEAFLNTLFPGLKLVRFETSNAALGALKAGEVDLAFGDGIALAFWLNGAQAAGCCAFLGGPFTESRYFGEGAGIVMRANAASLRQAIDYALWRINREGRYGRLYLKHFPVSPW
ncbi:MAG: transporter substrate-binding domain-containing protein [Proteobacteria bacterium]|nr:transporter substrate-binding domain-containing protein [Pseudomonadota bacterium]